MSAPRAPWPGRATSHRKELAAALQQAPEELRPLADLVRAAVDAEEASARAPWCAWTLLRAMRGGRGPSPALELALASSSVAAERGAASAAALMGADRALCEVLAGLDALSAWLEGEGGAVLLEPVFQLGERCGAPWVDDLRLLRAGVARSSDVKRLLCRDDVRAEWSRHLEEQLAESTTPPEMISAAADVLRFLDGYASFSSLLMAPAESPGLGAAVEHALERARAFLARDPAWRSSWDERPSGLFDDPTPLVGAWFPRGTILQALLEAGEPVHAQVAELLGELPAGPIRYYGDWSGIPPDSDDLGLFLALAADATATTWPTADWLAPLAALARPEDPLPTWLAPPDAPEHAHIEWLGDECVAVRLNLVHGLLRGGGPQWTGRALEELSRCCDAFVEADTGASAFQPAFHYGAPFAAVLFARCLEVSGAGDATGVAGVRDRLSADLLATQREDGSWGAALDTACTVRALTTLSTAGAVEALRRGLRWLCDEQHPDGGWAAAPLYVVPGMGRRQRTHGSRELTTALAMAAIARARAVVLG